MIRAIALGWLRPFLKSLFAKSGQNSRSPRSSVVTQPAALRTRALRAEILPPIFIRNYFRERV